MKIFSTTWSLTGMTLREVEWITWTGHAVGLEWAEWSGVRAGKRPQ